MRNLKSLVSKFKTQRQASKTKAVIIIERMIKSIGSLSVLPRGGGEAVLRLSPRLKVGAVWRGSPAGYNLKHRRVH